MRLTVALISDVFHDSTGASRLADRLSDARARGATLALLPELPLNPWSPASDVANDDDAEPPEGRRHQMLSTAAREAELGVVGGVIVRDPQDSRHNTALVFGPDGSLIATYRKVHLPDEAGFWETKHYEAGDELPSIIDAFGVRLGLQICSDINRPEGSHLLGAMGAEAILNPRATEAATFARWRTVLVATAMTSGAYMLSVNRPREEFGVSLGGPSLAVAPDGEVLVETVDPMALVTLDRAVVERARSRYPGYLATRADLYAEGWQRVMRTTRPRDR